MIIGRLRKELSHFSALPQQAKTLLTSYFFMSAAYPIIGTFINAYIFVNRQDVLSLIFYNLGNFGGISLAFFLNGLLLKKYNIKFLYFFGTILLGMAAISIVFYSGDNLVNYFFYGLIFCLGGGFHWGNRNYLTMSQTHTKNRTYFTALNFSGDTVIAIFVTFFVGWLIVWGLNYQMLMGVAFIILIIAGSVVLKADYVTPVINRIGIGKATREWKTVRWLQFGIGIGEGVLFFLPGFLILERLGNEGTLGTITAATSMISAVAIYAYGRKSGGHHRVPVLFSSIGAAATAALAMAAFAGNGSVVVYVLVAGAAMNFMWLNAGPLTMDATDREIAGREENRYAYVLDAENFLSLGRVASLAFCLAFVLVAGRTVALRFSPIVLYSLQILITAMMAKRLLQAGGGQLKKSHNPDAGEGAVVGAVVGDSLVL